jgi:hypothetical protein
VPLADGAVVTHLFEAVGYGLPSAVSEFAAAGSPPSLNSWPNRV